MNPPSLTYPVFMVSACMLASREILTRFNAEMVKVLKDPEVRAFMAREGSDPIGSTPEKFAAYFKRDVEKYAKVIKASGVQVD